MNEKLQKIIHVFIIIALILSASYGLIVVSEFVAYASLNSTSGTVTELIIEFTQSQNNYGGVAGVAVRVPGFFATQTVDLVGNTIEKENLLFDCLASEGEQEIYASQVPFASLDLTTVTAATTAEVDAYIGIPNSTITSAANTYTGSTTITLGSQTILNAPSTTTFTENLGASNFTTVLLKDANDELIFGSILINFTSCFDTDTCNFQQILPVVNGTNQTYYYWADPEDECPGGTTAGATLSLVIGNVSDTSGNRLENVIVDVAGYTTVSDSTGFYNLTTEVGTFNIYGILTGFQTYFSNVTVLANSTVVHNIIMTPQQVTNPFTDVGPGQDDPGTSTDIGPGQDVGPGQDQGPGEAPVTPVVEEPKRIEGKDYIISLQDINRRIREGNFLQETIKFFSFKKTTAQVIVTINGSVTSLIEMDKESLTIDPDGVGDLILTIFGRGNPGLYNGTLIIDGDMNATIPIYIELLPRDKLPVEALLLDIETSEKNYVPQNDVKFKADLRNMLIDRQYPVNLLFTVQNQNGDETIWTETTNVFLRTGLSIIKSFEVPVGTPPGDYILRVTANYLDLNSGTSTIFRVDLPWYKRSFIGMPVWGWLIILAVIGTGVFLYFYIKKKIEEKKRYHLKVNYDTMPKPGPRSIFVGKIAETDHKVYFNMEKFKVHTIVAGSTGGGKSVSAQVIIEEMLLKDVAVLVFDPTAQWTGMLRKCKDKMMLSLYGLFGMKPTEARAFSGNIREVTNSREVIDVMKFAKPGEIQIFAFHKIDPKEMDTVVANAIRQFFRSNLQESKPLRLMVVFDEVHRLLPKFGGSGDGFLQIERACREFRKWGIGVMLISQVLSDFMGTIKANINTEVQMRTRDEGDLERVRQKYGEDVLRSLVMATVGSGMVENPAYNDGKPFFVAFRPLLHSTERLSDEEISDYNKYNEQIDDLSYSLEQLETEGVDVFDLKLELKLALDKVKTGNFNVVGVYLEGLVPRIEKEWGKLGKQPKKYEKKLVSLEELQADIAKAKGEKAEYEAQQATESESNKKDEGEKGPPPWNKDADPSQILNLVNGMIVINQQSLYDEISAMKDEDFAKHVNDEKNDFADWIENAIGDPELASHVKVAGEKQKILDLLDLRKNEQDLPEYTEEEKAKVSEVDAFKELAKEPPATDEAKPAVSTDELKKEAEGTEVAVKEKLAKELVDKQEETETSESLKKEVKPAETAPLVEEVKVDIAKSEEASAETEKKAIPDNFLEEKKEEKEIKQEETKTEPTPTKTIDQDKVAVLPIADPETEKPVEEVTPQLPVTEETKTEAEPNLEQLIASDPEKYFKLENGKDLKSVVELKQYLEEMPDDIFSKHVGEDYNHFADWIEGVFQAKSIADHIRGIKNKHEMSEAL